MGVGYVNISKSAIPFNIKKSQREKVKYYQPSRGSRPPIWVVNKTIGNIKAEE